MDELRKRIDLFIAKADESIAFKRAANEIANDYIKRLKRAPTNDEMRQEMAKIGNPSGLEKSGMPYDIRMGSPSDRREWRTAHPKSSKLVSHSHNLETGKPYFGGVIPDRGYNKTNAHTHENATIIHSHLDKSDDAKELGKKPEWNKLSEKERAEGLAEDKRVMSSDKDNWYVKKASDKCQCENSTCKHGAEQCNNPQSQTVDTTYGPFKMCPECAKNMPSNYLKKAKPSDGYTKSPHKTWSSEEQLRLFNRKPIDNENIDNWGQSHQGMMRNYNTTDTMSKKQYAKHFNVPIPHMGKTRQVKKEKLPDPEDNDRYEYGNGGEIQLKPEHRIDEAESRIEKENKPEWDRGAESAHLARLGGTDKQCSLKNKHVSGFPGSQRKQCPSCGKAYIRKSIDPEELEQGIKVEMEHEDIVNGNKKVAEKIARDHLKERPDYYTQLKEMEAKPIEKANYIEKGLQTRHLKTEHSGAKHGIGAFHGRKKAAKNDSNKLRRRNAQDETNAPIEKSE